MKNLSIIGNSLNNGNVRWAVGASVLLNQYSLVDQPNDIDIFIEIMDYCKAIRF